MSDAPDWIEAAVEQAAEEVRRIAPLCSESGSVFAGMSRCTYTKCWQPCVCAAQARAAIAAFLREMKRHCPDCGSAEGPCNDPRCSFTAHTRTLAAAIERLGAPEKSDAP